MNQLNRTLLAIAIVVGGVLSAAAISPSLSALANAATGECGCGGATDASECGCGASEVIEHDSIMYSTRCTQKAGCRCKRCRKPRKKKINCPSCAVECDTCTLELDHYEEEKTCFKTEQKIICIPPVRFPWEECCPPGRTNKTRAINVLKVHKYKCKACGYKWKLDDLPEPENPEKPSESAAPAKPKVPAPPSMQSQSPASVDPVVAPVESQNLLAPPAEAPRPAFEAPAIPDGKAFDKVPPAPAG